MEDIKTPEQIEAEAKADKVITDFKFAFGFWKKWFEEAEKDITACLGDMYKKEDLDTLAKRGVKALTINKIKPNVKLLSGIESQNRTDYFVSGEGAEDNLKAEIATRLLKNIMKRCDGDIALTDNFRIKLMTGLGYIEPYIDFTDDLLNGDMKLKVLSPFQVLPDPNGSQRDLSDCGFVIKTSTGLTKEDLKELFPEQEAIIESCNSGIISMLSEGYISTSEKKPVAYDNASGTDVTGQESKAKNNLYDLIEYHYKKSIKKYFVVDTIKSTITKFDSEEEAMAYEQKLQDAIAQNQISEIVSQFGEQSEQYQNILKNGFPKSDSFKIITRWVKEIWTTSMIGEKTILKDERCWSYPKYKGYPIIPDYAFKLPIVLPKKDKQHLYVQGIVRDIRDVNFELNKRRTQELHILNSSANSGFMMEEGACTPEQEKAYKDFGSSPGVVLKWRQGKPKPEKIQPTQLSQGHAQLAAENANDIKEISGINTDLLAMNESQASGRAIALRQKQGLVMIQEIFDNFNYAKQVLGRFMLSQLFDVYDSTEVKKILGNDFIEKNFGIQQVDQINQQVIMTIDENKLNQTIQEVLTGDELQKYDVALGENPQSDTVKIANYQMLTELAKSGMPIPMEVLLEESLLSNATKAKIKEILSQQPQPLPK